MSDVEKSMKEDDLTVIYDIGRLIRLVGVSQESAMAILAGLSGQALVDAFADDGLKASVVLPREVVCEREAVLDRDWWVVSFEEPEIIPWADAYLGITRAIASPCDYGSGPYFLAARQGSAPLESQVKEIVRSFSLSGGHRRVAVVDDGVSGGLTCRVVISMLAAYGMKVESIGVIINRSGITEISGARVVSIGQSPITEPWINGRDIFWGLPRSGVSILKEGIVVGGVPYALFQSSVARRLGLGPERALAFRRASLALSIGLWSRVEECLGRIVTFADIPRFAFNQSIGHDRVINRLQQWSTFDDEKMRSIWCTP